MEWTNDAKNSQKTLLKLLNLANGDISIARLLKPNLTLKHIIL